MAITIEFPYPVKDVSVNLIHTSWVKKPTRKQLTFDNRADRKSIQVYTGGAGVSAGIIEIIYKEASLGLEITAYHKIDGTALASKHAARAYAAEIGIKVDGDDPAPTPLKRKHAFTIIRAEKPHINPSTITWFLDVLLKHSPHSPHPRDGETITSFYTKDEVLTAFDKWHTQPAPQPAPQPVPKREPLTLEKRKQLQKEAGIPESYFEKIEKTFSAPDCIFEDEAKEYQNTAKKQYQNIKALEPTLFDGKPVHKQFPLLIQLLQHSADQNVYLYGPAGTGKTFHAALAAKALNLEFEFCGSLSEPYQLTGYRQPNGDYVPTLFRKIFENGGVFLYDEIDGSHPAVLLTFSAALSNGFMTFPDQRVERHPQCYIIAAGNTNGMGATTQFTGRARLDQATIDRFAFLEWNVDETLEATFTSNPSWLKSVRAARKAWEVNKLQTPFPTSRAVIKGEAMLKAGISVDVVKESLLVKGDAKAREAYKNV